MPARGSALMERLPEIEFLRQVPLFHGAEESVLRELWYAFRERRLRKGDVLFRTGDPGEELFVLKEGSIVVTKPVTGRVEQVLARLEPGEAFGEMSVFGDERHRSATCQADADSVLYSLDRDSLARFVAGSPATAAKFFQHMAQVAFQRLRDSSDLVAEVTRWGLEATGLDVEHK
jgi:CRP-like cAMP-binding protein